MQIRATLSPSEAQQAARLGRPRRFWLRFVAANLRATTFIVFIAALAIGALFTGSHPRWGLMAAMFAFFAALIGWSWYRVNAGLAKAAMATSARALSLSLDPDGVRTVLASGASSFVPWACYEKWQEGKNIFLLTGKEGAAILPIDEGYGNSIRDLLKSKIGSSA